MSVKYCQSKKVLVGLSGGVDSAVAAVLLLEQGYTVTGATMAVYDGPAGASRGGAGACYDCGEQEDIAEAADLAALLGIPHHVFDCTTQYRRLVLDYFKEMYLAGKTPNPCVRCNPLLKFGLLPALAGEIGLDSVFATGHYARVEYSERYGRRVLLRGHDAHKDQSYFLYRLEQNQLDHALFPLGGMTKGEVRALAASHNLPVHNKPESQNFYSGDYADLLDVPDRPGNIVDTRGGVLGTHTGFWHFTPGQRRGLGVAAKTPLYVQRVDPMRNEVVVGSHDEILLDHCVLDDLHWHIPFEQAGTTFTAQMRSSQRPIEVTARLYASGTLLDVSFAEPQTGVAPGQSLVLYLDDLVVGGGIICKAIS